MTAVLRLSHVTLRCPDLAASLAFFTDVLGLVETERDGGSAALRCFGERRRCSLLLRESAEPGIEASAWLADEQPFEVNGPRTAPDRLNGTVAPDGHRVQLVTSDAAAPAPTVEVRARNQPSPQRGEGIEPRRLSHLGLACADPERSARWWCRHLGFEIRERVAAQAGTLVSLGVTQQPLDLVLIGSEHHGGLHHVAFAVDARDDLLRAVDLLAEHGVKVESGPGQHGFAQLAYVYAIEPSGNRIALTRSPLLALPGEWEPVIWEGDDARRGLRWWGAPLPPGFFGVPA